MNLKFGEYWEINEKDLLKLCQKLENSVKPVVCKQNGFVQQRTYNTKSIC